MMILSDCHGRGLLTGTPLCPRGAGGGAAAGEMKTWKTHPGLFCK